MGRKKVTEMTTQITVAFKSIKKVSGLISHGCVKYLITFYVDKTKQFLEGLAKTVSFTLAVSELRRFRSGKSSSLEDFFKLISSAVNRRLIRSLRLLGFLAVSSAGLCDLFGLSGSSLGDRSFLSSEGLLFPQFHRWSFQEQPLSPFLHFPDLFLQ